MKPCPRCGYDFDTNDKFCGFCGFNIITRGNEGSFTQNELKLSDIRLNLGIVYLKQGKNDLAVELFEKILKQEPENLKVKQMLENAKPT